MTTNTELNELSAAFDLLRHHAKNGTVQTKFEIIKFAEELTTTAETQAECLSRIGFASLQTCLAILGCHRGIFAELARMEAPTKAIDMAENIGLDTKTTGRLMRAMATYWMLSEVEPGVYVSNDTTRTLALSYAAGSLKHVFYNCVPTFRVLDQWLSNTSSESSLKSAPQDNFAYRLAFDTDESMYTHVSHRDEGQALQWLSSYMESLNDDVLSWFDVFAVKEQVADMSLDQVLWVDVGAGFGHRTRDFCAKFPDLPGKLYAQDLPQVIATTAAQHGVELMPHDFFDAQPIKGAKFYYLRFILHDFSDEDCVRILLRLKDAMASNSIVLIDEILVPEMHAHHLAVDWDLTMMCLLGSRERTISEFREIFEKAGLELISTGTYKPTMGMSVMALRAVDGLDRQVS